MRRCLKTWIMFLGVSLLLIPITSIIAQDNGITLTAKQQAEIEAIIRQTLDVGQVGTVGWLATPTDAYSWVGGLASEANAVPMTPDASFRVASIAKPFVAATLLLMQEDGLLELDDPLRDYLPDIAASFSCGDEITIRHLLNHTSSLYSFTSSVAEVDVLLHSDRVVQPQELVAIAANVPYNCLYSPGNSFNYSNTNYIIAAMVIEAAAGRNAYEEIRARVIDPLAMEDTYMRGVESERGSLVDNHTEFGPFDYNPSVFWPGETISNGPDLIRFVRGVYTGDIFASPSSHDEMMHFVGAPGDDLSKEGYGLGVRKFAGEPLVVGHGGNIPGNLSQILYAPEIDVIAIILTNSDFSPDFDTLATAAAMLAVVGVDFALPGE